MKAREVLLIAIFLAAFLAKLYFVTREPLLYNNDAGYYVQHIGEVLRDGFPHVSDPPLAFYYAAAFAAVFGVMLGYKIAISLLSAAIAFPAYLIARRITGKSEAGLAAAFLAAFSATNMFMMGDLLKNMAGLFFGAWFLYFTLRASGRFDARDAIFACLFALLMAGSHFSSAAYVMLAMAPYLVYRPLRDYLGKSFTRESMFCLGLAAMLAVVGLAVIWLGGIGLSGGRLGIVGIYDGGGFSQEPFQRYAVFAVPAILGLLSLERKHLELFLPYVAVGILLAQPFFVDPGWQGRFSWNAYIPVAILAAAGAARFSGDRLLFGGVMLALAAYTLAGFVTAGQSISPIITEGEWEGLLSLHRERPDMAFEGMEGGMRQWAEAAGFTVRPGGGHLLVCDRSAPPQGSWYSGACGMTANAGPEELARLQDEASFGRFHVVPAGWSGPGGGQEPLR
jgi:hypothetical protein